MSETLDPVAMELDQRQAEQLLVQAKEQGVELVGPNGLLNQLTKNVLETALDAVFVPVARCQTADRAEGVDERCRCEAGVLGNGELEQFAGAVVIKQRGDIEIVEGPCPAPQGSTLALHIPPGRCRLAAGTGGSRRRAVDGLTRARDSAIDVSGAAPV